MKKLLVVAGLCLRGLRARNFHGKTKRLLMVAGGLLLAGRAFGQSDFGGGALFSGAMVSASTSGAPLTYLARTDNCVNGTQSGCLSGTTTGEAGSSLTFQEGASDPIPSGFLPNTSGGYIPAAQNSAATDPDFGAYMVMGTDPTTAVWSANPYAVSFNNVGSDGEHDSFSMDETLLLVLSNGNHAAVYNVSPTNIHAKACSVGANNCINYSGIGSSVIGLSCTTGCTTLQSNGSFSWAKQASQPHTLYEVASSGLQVNQVVFNSSITNPGNGTFNRTLLADFTSDTPTPCSVLPPITVGSNTSNYTVNANGDFAVGNDGSFSQDISGGYDWLPSWTPADANGNTVFIQPTVNNAGGYIFVATTISGATSTSEPTWPQTVGNTVADGSVTWTNFEKCCSQGASFQVVSWRPNHGCSVVNTYNGKIYRGHNWGPSYPASAASVVPAVMTTNDVVTCARSNIGPPCPFTDRMTLHEADQLQNGAFFSLGAVGGESLIPPGSWNSGGGTCQPAGSADFWAGPWSSTYSGGYSINATVAYSGNYYVSNINSNASTPPTNWTMQEALCFYVVEPDTGQAFPLSAWTVFSGHHAGGYGQSYYAAGYKTVVYSSLVCPPAVGCQQAYGANGPIAAYSGINLFSTPLPSQFHGTNRNAGFNDLPPVGISATDVPAWPARYTGAGYAEIIAVNSQGTGTLWRFAHSFNTGSSSNFSDQNNIGVIGPLGDLFAIGTDMMGTRGSDLGTNSQCNNLRGQVLGAPGVQLAPGATGGSGIYGIAGPDIVGAQVIVQATVAGTVTGNTPTGGFNRDGPAVITGIVATSTQAVYSYTYDAVNNNPVSASDNLNVSALSNTQFNGTGLSIAAVTGSAGSGTFTVNGSYTAGTYSDGGNGYVTQAWGTATVENLGVNNCRSDIVLIDTLSAHAAP